MIFYLSIRMDIERLCGRTTPTNRSRKQTSHARQYFEAVIGKSLKLTEDVYQDFPSFIVSSIALHPADDHQVCLDFPMRQTDGGLFVSIVHKQRDRVRCYVSADIAWDTVTTNGAWESVSSLSLLPMMYWARWADEQETRDGIETLVKKEQMSMDDKKRDKRKNYWSSSSSFCSRVLFHPR